MRFWRTMTKSQQMAFAVLLTAAVLDTLLWVYFGRYAAVEHWNVRRARWDPAGPTT